MAGGELTMTRPDDGTLVIRLGGDWDVGTGVPSTSDVENALAGTPKPVSVSFDTSALGAWDSSLLMTLTRIIETASSRDLAMDREGMPNGVKRLLALSEAVPEKTDAKTGQQAQPLVERVGEATLARSAEVVAGVDFLGSVVESIGAFFRRSASYRKADFRLLIQQCGVEALPIVSLVTFLLGLILAFVGAIQLTQFGASIYVANLVGIGMVRDMGALMAGIVMAGRSGAAFAAQIGSMQVNEEIDALETTGISPMQFLVMPRVLALVLMMPLLTVFADVMGILGGMTVGVLMLDLSVQTYFQQTVDAISLTDLFGGLLKAGVYGGLIALAGCLEGIRSGRSASAVGDAATSAVVKGIVWIIVACGMFAFLFYVLGI